MELHKTINKYKSDDFRLQDIIGVGTFAQIYFAKNEINNKFYAIKQLIKNDILKHKQIDHVKNEINILHIIEHPFIVKLEGWFQDSKYLYIILQLVLGGEVFYHLRNVERFNLYQAQFYAGQVLTIFEYLHFKNIIYRDLKPENILIDKTGYIKLTDFGFSKFCEDKTYTLCGTPEYLAPEIILNKGHGKPVDWWSLGVFIYEMLAGFCPFTSDDTLTIYKNIISCNLKFPKFFDKAAKSICKHLMEVDLSKRLGNMEKKSLDIRNHRFFKDINFNNLLNFELKPPFIPIITSNTDLNNFSKHSNKFQNAQILDIQEDPFLNW